MSILQIDTITIQKQNGKSEFYFQYQVHDKVIFIEYYNISLILSFPLAGENLKLWRKSLDTKIVLDVKWSILSVKKVRKADDYQLSQK